jgi:hypothetical protein
MATSGRGSGVVGYNVQVAVDTEHHLIVAHEVTNSGSDRSQLANMAKQAKAVLQAEELAAVADRGYFSSSQILECAEADITVTLPKGRAGRGSQVDRGSTGRIGPTSGRAAGMVESTRMTHSGRASYRQCFAAAIAK